MAWKKTEEVFVMITGPRFVCANADVMHTKPTAKLVTMEVKKECLFNLGRLRWGGTITKMTESSTNIYTLSEMALIAKCHLRQSR